VAISVEQRNLAILAKWLAPAVGKAYPTVTEFAAKSFYIPETERPLQLMKHQSVILDYAFDLKHNFSTIVYSSVKKSGKTAIAALVARWIAETWGRSEVLALANDMEQARGRIYQKVLDSIEMDPNYISGKRILPGRWRIIERDATCLSNGSILRAVSSDYRGEAGSNPTATLWSEAWAYTSEASHRLWDELTPVPTRERSIRYVETYAGFEDESDLLIDLYRRSVLKARRLTHNDIDWPFDDQPPIYVNDKARSFAYWDDGVVARRMPWQTQAYYDAQEATLRPQAFERLHLNYWTSSVSSFIPVEWWNACFEQLPIPTIHEPMVLGVDAAVSSDCCAVVGVTRHPKRNDDVAVRLCRVWTPPTNGKIDLDITVKQAIIEICSTHNVVEVAYDPYQLHSIMTDLVKAGVAWCRPFSQGESRMIADKQLYDLIKTRHLSHIGHPDMADHIKNAAAKQNKDEDTKLRIVKKMADQKIDSVIATSMAVAECKRLLL
jgi:phage terminase large subunit-like protein